MGHVTHDHVDGGRMRIGGAALYASLTARRLGKRAAVLTSFGKDFAGRPALQGIAAKVVPATRTSGFRHIYDAGGRVQFVREEAASLTADDLPANWTKAGLVYLCPVLHEVPMEMHASFPDSWIGVAPQGWLRRWDKGGTLRVRRWEGFETLLGRSQMVIVSEEDIVGEWGVVDAFREHAPIVILTRAGEGAMIFSGRRALILGSYPANEQDPTGAGDCFGAAFLVRYAETADVEEAGRFAACVGACVVEQEGIAGIPTREAVENRMRKESISCQWTTG